MHVAHFLFTPRDTEHLWRTTFSQARDKINAWTSIVCSLLFPSILLLTCAARWAHPRYTWPTSDVESSKSTFFCSVAHISRMFWVFSATCISSTYTDKNYFHFAKKLWAVSSGDLSNPSSSTFLKYCLPSESRQWVTVKMALQRYNWIVNWVPILSVIWSKSLDNFIRNMKRL